MVVNGTIDVNLSFHTWIIAYNRCNWHLMLLKAAPVFTLNMPCTDEPLELKMIVFNLYQLEVDSALSVLKTTQYNC